MSALSAFFFFMDRRLIRLILVDLQFVVKHYWTRTYVILFCELRVQCPKLGFTKKSYSFCLMLKH